MVTTPPPAATPSKEEPHPAAAELDLLEQQAAELEGGGPAAPGASGQAQASNTAAELREALGMLRLIGRPAFSDWPAYGVEVWTDAQLQAIADHGGAIMDRHGWTMGELWTTWGPYIALIGALAGPSLDTWGHLKARKLAALRAAQARQAAKDKPAPNPPEEADGVRP